MNHKTIKGHIRGFLRNHYSDERLAAFGAHVQDGKFNVLGCCCLVGSVNATHPLTANAQMCGSHYNQAKFTLRGAVDAERALIRLTGRIGKLSSDRVLLSICRAEMRRRDRKAIADRAAAVPAQDFAAALISQHMVAK